MNWILWTIVAISAVAAILFFTGWGRYMFTAFLIARVTPYEQSGTGTGSILVIGDSTGYGTGASRSNESVAGRLGADFPGYEIKNNSVNGRKIAGAREVVANLPESNTYELVLLQIGANDLIAGRESEVVAADMQQLIEAVKPHADHIVIISAGNIGATSAFSGERAQQLEDTSRQYDQAMRTLEQSYENVHFVSLFDEKANDPFVISPRTHTAVDGLHPTSLGYDVWYQKAKPHFTAALEQPQ